ncbi:MAG: tetratricopeptide repeat protein [Bryobacteraceae bacterium]
MKTLVLTLALVVLTAPVSAQRRRLTAINAETPEGKLLQSIGQESDPAKKIALLEQFTTEFPQHEAVGWVYSQVQPLYTSTGNPDKAIEIGEKLLEQDANDLEAAYGNLKAAEAKKDPDGVLKWAVATSEIARKLPESQKPEDMEEEAWKNSLDYAKQVDTYTEYALYATALQTADPQKSMLLAETLAQRSPDSQYVPQVLGRYAGAAGQLKAMDKAVVLGEAAFARNQFNEDMLLAMADYYMQQKKQQEKALLYANKAAEVLESKPKPDGMEAADWEKKKNSSLGLAQWMAGVTYSGQNKFAEANKSLRAALPLVDSNDQLKAAALFHLGLVNYKMGQKSRNKGQIADAVKFSQQSAAIKGPYQAQARKNLAVIKAEFGVR